MEYFTLGTILLIFHNNNNTLTGPLQVCLTSWLAGSSCFVTADKHNLIMTGLVGSRKKTVGCCISLHATASTNCVFILPGIISLLTTATVAAATTTKIMTSCSAQLSERSDAMGGLSPAVRDTYSYLLMSDMSEHDMPTVFS
ncbi:hypothetical protein CBL_10709 [Carabus blaptoides fortunei]